MENSQIYGQQPSVHLNRCLALASKIMQKLTTKLSDLVEFRLSFFTFQIYLHEIVGEPVDYSQVSLLTYAN